MDIAQVAKKTGVRASTLRFYEEKGLIHSVGRDGLRRRFGPEVLDQLALIALGQAGGLSLDEIGSMLLPDGKFSIDRQMLAAKAKELDGTIRRLKAMSRGLAHAAVCPATNHASCPTFQKLLRAAGSGALSKAKTDSLGNQ
jgi:DNA-binding transcriptional MerR regulator